MIKTRRLLAVVVFVAAACMPLAVLPLFAQQTEHAKQVGGKFMCMCNCSQVLTQCNHVGCTTSAAMLKELDQAIARGDSETSITQMFVQEFGTKVYAEPPKSGLSLVAWSLPTVYLVVGAGLVIFVISRWRNRPAPQPAALAGGGGGTQTVSPDILARAREQAARDTED
jgi:cytochrome c-type biogenesis protein CcmH/NrfF